MGGRSSYPERVAGGVAPPIRLTYNPRRLDLGHGDGEMLGHCVILLLARRKRGIWVEVVGAAYGDGRSPAAATTLARDATTTPPGASTAGTAEER
jgi:hypothetical protein